MRGRWFLKSMQTDQIKKLKEIEDYRLELE